VVIVAVKWKTVKNDFPSMEQSLKMLDKREVNVGYIGGGEQAWLAGIHEYGCIITVTPKMRVWLHAHGLHLKSSTTTITIPERSFLRSGFDKYHEEVIDKCEKAIGNVLIKGDVDQFLEFVGELLRDKIQDFATDEVQSPPKHPFSLEMNPGKTNPLVISGDMIAAITYEVK
jgi:hypothetical protein